MKKPKLKKYPTGGSKGFIQDKLVHYVGQGETPYTREQLGAMGYNYETTTDGFDEYSMGDNRRFYKTVLPNSPGWNNPENPYLTNTAKPAVAKVGHKTGPYPSYGSPEYIQAHPEYTPPKPRIPTFAGGGEFAPIPEKDSLYIEDRLKKDPYLSAKYKYKVVEDRKKGDVLYRTMPNGKDVPVNFNNMKELDRQAYKVKMDRDLQSTGQKPIYNVFAPPTFKHGGMKLPKYYEGDIHMDVPEDPGLAPLRKPNEPVASAADQQQIDNTQTNNNQLSSGQYAAIGSASATGTANIYNAYNSPGTSEWQKNQQAGKAIEKTETQVAGAINPIVGMIHGTVSGIMDKSTAEATKTDSQGNLVNRKQAKNQAIGRAFADPMAMIPTMISTGFNRDRYANQIEADAKARIAEEQAPMFAAQEAKRNMYHTYAQGGIHSGMPNAEVEKQELMHFPNGDTHQVDGPTHNSGGVPVNIPDGTRIFSDRLKDPTTKKTFAKMAEKYKVKDLDSNSTPLKKSTEELNNKIKQDKLDKIFKAQENLKALKMSKYASKLGLDPVNYANGGTKLPQYGGIDPKTGLPITGTFDQYQPAGPIEDSRVEDTRYEDQITAAKDLSNSLIDRPDLLNMSMNTSRESFGYRRPVNSSEDLQSMTPISNKDLEIRNNQNRLPNTLPTVSVPNKASTPTNDPKVRKMNPDWIEPTVNTLVQNAGNIAYLAGEGKKYDKQDFYKYNPELYNPADALRAADIEANVNRNRLKDASGGNAGALMSNLTQSQAVNTLLKSKIRTDAANQNASTLNDAQVRNIQGKYNVDDINARNKGQALTNYYNAIRGIGQNTSGAYRDWKRGEVDQQTLDIISKNYPDYVYDKRRKGWYHKSTDKKLE